MLTLLVVWTAWIAYHIGGSFGLLVWLVFFLTGALKWRRM